MSSHRFISPKSSATKQVHEVAIEYHSVNTVVQYFDRKKSLKITAKNPCNFFTVAVCSELVVRFAPPHLQQYIGQPLGVVIVDYPPSKWNHHQIL